MLDVNAKKGTGLGDLFKGYIPQQLEETRAVKVERNPLFDRLRQHLEEYQQLEKFMEHQAPDTFSQAREKYHTYLQDYVTEILPPAAINAFLQGVGEYISAAESKTVGQFMTHLIQNSHDAGYNDFALDTLDVGTIDYLADTLRGKSRSLLQITIDGPIGNYTLAHARKVVSSVKTQSKPLFTAHKVRDVTLTIDGPAGISTGAYARHSSFIITGNPGPLHQGYGLGMCAWFSDFTIMDFFPQGQYLPLDSEIKTFGCTFRTADEKTMENILRYLPLGNRAIFIHPDGTEETLWKKHFVERIKYRRERGWI